MISENPVFWQAVVFAIWGYLSALMCNALVGFPRRLVEAS